MFVNDSEIYRTKLYSLLPGWCIGPRSPWVGDLARIKQAVLARSVDLARKRSLFGSYCTLLKGKEDNSAR